MDQNQLKSHLAKLVGQRNVFLFFSAILSFAVILLTILLFSKKERIVIEPTNGAPSYWIEEGRASSGYVEKMGLFLSDLILNRSPADVETRNQIILRHVHPSAYHEMRKLLLQEQETILKGDQSYFFQTGKNYVDMEKNAFVIEGEFFIMVGKNGKAPAYTHQAPNKYTLRFSSENGKLLLTSLKKEEA
jgi:type IV conjugative transfer system protein TraE